VGAEAQSRAQGIGGFVVFGVSEIPRRGRLGRRFLHLAGSALAAGLVATMVSLSVTAAAAAPGRRAAATVAGRLQGVACASSKSCVAVGGRSSTSTGPGGTLAEKWNGTTWAVVKSPDPPGSTGAVLNGVACTSTKNCLAVGNYFTSSHTTLPAAERWNGSKWSVVSVPAPSGATDASLAAVSCTSSTNCQAVGINGENTLAESWNGAKWKIVPSPNPVPGKPNDLSGVACPATSECWAVGLDFAVSEGAGLTEKWNGSKWSAVTTPASKGGELIGDGCFSKTDCMSVGIGDNLFVIGQHWNGSKWVTATPVNPSGAASSQLSAVSCPGSSVCEAVGNNSDKTTLAEGWNGTRWAIQSTSGISGSAFANLAGDSCVTTGNCWAVGVSETSTGAATPVIEHWNGKSWSLTSG
jgi:hypothetical protein